MRLVILSVIQRVILPANRVTALVKELVILVNNVMELVMVVFLVSLVTQVATPLATLGAIIANLVTQVVIPLVIQGAINVTLATVVVIPLVTLGAITVKVVTE